MRRSVVPLLIIASDSDPYLNAHDAHALYSESAASEKQLQVLRGSAHGTAILDGPEERDYCTGSSASYSRIATCLADPGASFRDPPWRPA